MRRLTGILLAVLVLGVTAGCQESVTGLAGTDSSPTLSDKPGPGDKQCIPGQHGSPKPGKKAGACSNQ
jgi:hypothetical protein